MGRFIVKIRDKYLEWSTVVDAPISWGMDREEFEEFYIGQYGERVIPEFKDRMRRVDDKGVSAYHYESASELIAYNRAGKNERNLTEEELYHVFCVEKGGSVKDEHTHGQNQITA